MPYHTHFVPTYILQYFGNKKLDELYISVFIKYLAQSLITIFVPIFLFTLGFTLVDIAIYYLIFYTIAALITPLGLKLNHWIGVKKTLTLGIILFIVYYSFLNRIETGASYYLLATLAGLSSGLYFAAFHIEVTRTFQKKQEARNLSVLQSLALIAGILGPLLGAFFIQEGSFQTVFRIVAVLLLFSVVPLFFSRDFYEPKRSLTLKTVLNEGKKSSSLAYTAHGMLFTVIRIFWPLFIFITLGSVLSLGVITSTASVFVIGSVLIVGSLADKNRDKILKYSIYAHAPSWLIRLIFLNPIGLFLTNTYSLVTFSSLLIAYEKNVLAQAKKSNNKGAYFLYRDAYLLLGRVLMLLFIIITNSLTLLFIAMFFITFFFLNALKHPN